jgi:hypothetical protein
VYTSCVIVGWGLTLLMVSQLPINKKIMPKFEANYKNQIFY